MKAVRIARYGGPDVLLHEDIPVPEPAPDEALVRLRHSGINFMDVHTRQGKYEGSRTYPVRLPTTLGIEGAGEVVALGQDVRDLRVGDRVAYCLHWGSYADYATVPAWKLAPVPDALPLDQGAAAMFHGLTAHYLAHDLGRAGPGVSWLVHAASGGIGQLLVQMGAQLGVTVYATTSTPAKAAVARARGATEAVPYEGFAEAVREMTSGRGVDVVFDPVGRPTLRESLRVARRQGLVVNFGAVGGAVRDLDPIELGEAGSLFLTRPRLADHLPDATTVRRRAADVFRALLDGTLSIEIASRHTMEDVAVAHEELESRRAVGKLILDLH
ncbi:quinone oxidoreductase [Roseomonas sp. SSH11]|uniref:Quinone oxidoreductase n=1 Tax=Pararoseomonas baculiformis TaxID=2820812 RepID=A0ABS4AFS8_9PROT|nr:quinone oxidoreductase [Pararoseomonas baculiformis]MBP0445872.1 quinone oxidoreductase [Pararoseomonas baculiformis]